MLQDPPKQPTTADDDMFLLDGFDEDQLYANEHVDGGQERGNPLAFPQSDDEEISTDGRYGRLVVGGATSGGTMATCYRYIRVQLTVKGELVKKLFYMYMYVHCSI